MQAHRTDDGGGDVPHNARVVEVQPKAQAMEGRIKLSPLRVLGGPDLRSR